MPFRYCISCRSNRPIQTVERTFFTEVDVGNIPVMAVFTQFDTLEKQYYADLDREHRRRYGNASRLENIESMAHAQAIADYDQNYRQALVDIIGPNSGVGIVRVSIPPTYDSDSSSSGGSGMCNQVRLA
jgi:hypothetical protein